MDAKQKNILIGGLLAIVLVMAVGYAAFATQLQITGTASVDSQWDVAIISVTPSASAGEQTTVNGRLVYPQSGDISHSNTATTATFNTNLKTPGDTVTYTITIKNRGTLPARVKTNGIKWIQDAAANPQVEDTTAGDEPIKYSYNFANSASTLTPGAETTMTVTVTYDPADNSTQPASVTKTATLVIDYEQVTS